MAPFESSHIGDVMSPQSSKRISFRIPCLRRHSLLSLGHDERNHPDLARPLLDITSLLDSHAVNTELGQG